MVSSGYCNYQLPVGWMVFNLYQPGITKLTAWDFNLHKAISSEAIQEMPRRLSNLLMTGMFAGSSMRSSPKGVSHSMVKAAMFSLADSGLYSKDEVISQPAVGYWFRYTM